PSSPKPGDEETITVQVTNKGQDPALGVAVSIQVPPGTQVTQPAQGMGWTCVPNGQVYLCTRDRADLGPAPPITLKVVTPTVAPGDSAPQLGASVDAGSATDPTPADNSATIPLGDGLGIKLAGGGFVCSIDPQGSPTTGIQLAFGALMAVLLRRRLRR